MHRSAIFLQTLVAASIFFVWVVRYGNIIEEFRQYKYPDWLRDLVGILKLACAALLMVGVSQPFFALAGGAGIAMLMIGAVITHLRVKNPIARMLPSLVLFICSIVIVVLNCRFLKAG